MIIGNNKYKTTRRQDTQKSLQDVSYNKPCGRDAGWLCSRAAPSDCEEDTRNRDLAESPRRLVVFPELAAFKIVWPSADDESADEPPLCVPASSFTICKVPRPRSVHASGSGCQITV